MRNANSTIRLDLGGLVVLLAMLALVPAARASTISADGDSLDIVGDPNADAITVSTDGTTLTVVDTGTGGATTADPDCTQVNPTTVRCPVNSATSAVDRFEVELDNGVDSFTNTNFVTENGHVHSSDQLLGGPATGVKTIAGGPGSQDIDGGQASDRISGGDGDDFIFDGGAGIGSPSPTGGNDILDGGNGEDTTEYFRQGDAPLSLTFDGLANDGQAGETDNLLNIENAVGGPGDDLLVGDAFANNIDGGDGNDTINGMGGNDQLAGEFGNGIGLLTRGVAAPAPTNDTLIGGTGRDGLNCGTGPDIAIREPGDDVDASCERIGADVSGDSAGLGGKKKNKFKVGVECPESEGVACIGKLAVTSNGKTIGKGKFNIAPGATKQAKAKLKKKGAKAVTRAGGSLLVSVHALTDEPAGVSEGSGTVLIFK